MGGGSIFYAMDATPVWSTGVCDAAFGTHIFNIQGRKEGGKEEFRNVWK